VDGTFNSTGFNNPTLADVQFEPLGEVTATAVNTLDLKFVCVDDQGRLLYSFRMHHAPIRILITFKNN
jgi:hypothetical protein